jgi:predicted HicB family RNase H-like nuclease
MEQIKYKQVTINIPENIHYQAGIIAKIEKVSLSSVVTSYLTDYVKKHKDNLTKKEENQKL